MPDSPVISGVADLPKFYFAEGAPFRLTLTIGAEFSMTGKFVTFGMRARSGTVRRVFGTDSGESNLTIAGQVITLDIATSAATVPAFASGWTLEDVQAKGETEYWVDISATEGSDVLLRLQGQADWVAPGSDIADSNAVVASPSIDVNISSGAVSVSVAVSGGGGTGDVVGPASATDNAIARYNLTTGKLIQDSGITIADGASGTLAGTNSGDVTLAGTPAYLTLANQVITRNQINLTAASAHVTGTLPVANGGTGQTALSSIDAADFGSGAAADNYVLTADGSGGAAWEAASGGGGSSITGTGFAYVRTGGDNATAVIGDPSKPYSTGQAAWAAGATRFDFGPGSFSIDASYASGATPGAIYMQGVGSESIVTLTWRGQDVVDSAGVDSPALNLYSDKSAVIVLTIAGGNATGDTGSFNGGNVGDYAFYNCYINSLTITPGTGNFGNGTIPSNASAEFTTIVSGSLQASNILRNGVLEGGVFYPSPISDGDKGHITVSSSGTVWQLDQNVVALPNLVQASAKGKIIGRKTAGSGNFEECVIGDFVDAAAVTTSNITDTTGAVANVSGMSFSIAANEKVSATFRGFWATNTSGSGFKYAFTGPASPTDVQIGDFSFTSSTAVRTESGITAFSTTATQGGGTLINSAMPIMIQIYVCNGSTPGTVQLQIGGEVNGSTFTLYKGFTMQVLRIP